MEFVLQSGPESGTADSAISPEAILRIVEVFAIVAAVVISVLALIRSGESNETAREALHVARQQNDIALGVIHETPDLTINASFARDIRLTTLSELRQPKEIVIDNTGRVPIVALGVELVAADALTYPIHHPDEPYSGPLVFMHETVSLNEQLAPNAILRLNVAPFVVRYFRSPQFGSLAYPNDRYRSLVAAIITAQRVGESIPSPAGEHSRVNLSIELTPSIISSKLGREAADSKPTYEVYGP